MAQITSIMRETEKAICAYIKLEDGSLSNRAHWFPRSAISHNGDIAEWIFKQKWAEDQIEEEKDRFGRTIPVEVVTGVKRTAENLLKLGFRESKKKKNLFYIPLSVNHPNEKTISVFVDLRGSEVIPIYEDARGMVWTSDVSDYRVENIWDDEKFIHLEDGFEWSKWNGFGISPSETQEYFTKYIREYLQFHGISTRETFDLFTVNRDKYEEFENTSADELEQKVKSAKGYLEEYSNEIKKYSKVEQWKVCRICNKSGTPSGFWSAAIESWEKEGVKLELHHISYIPEIVIPVCKTCHNKIHNTEELAHLKPEMKREEWLESRKSS